MGYYLCLTIQQIMQRNYTTEKLCEGWKMLPRCISESKFFINNFIIIIIIIIITYTNINIDCYACRILSLQPDF